MADEKTQTVRDELLRALEHCLPALRHYGSPHDIGNLDCPRCKTAAAIERAKREPEGCCIDAWNDWNPPMVKGLGTNRITVKRPLPEGKP